MSKFIESSKNMERLQSEDISNAILYTIQAPNHMNVTGKVNDEHKNHH
jgi:NADP-dependent 3-hydroxy acid dehydrogenase YdfG